MKQENETEKQYSERIKHMAKQEFDKECKEFREYLNKLHEWKVKKCMK